MSADRDATAPNRTSSDTNDRGDRWVGVGSSANADTAAAGQTATLAALDGRNAELVLLFCSVGHELDTLASAVKDAAGGAAMIGCSTAGEISTDGPSDGAVVVVAIGGAGIDVATTAVTGVSSRLYEAGAEVAGCVERTAPGGHRALLLLTDGLAGDQEQIVRGAYAEVGAEIPLVGGCAGDDMAMRQTVQFFDGRVLTDAIVGAAIRSEGPIGIGVSHGWRTIGEPVLVTGSGANRVRTLDERPALDVYLDRFDPPTAVRSDADAFTRFAQTHPFGLNHWSGTAVRFVAEADFDDRSLGCIADVPEGGLAWFMEGDEASVLEATDAACSAALDALEGRAPIGIVAFDCIGRRGVLGTDVSREVSRIVDRAGGAPVAGFYTYGEFARTSGVAGFHNHTLVVFALG